MFNKFVVNSEPVPITENIDIVLNDTCIKEIIDSFAKYKSPGSDGLPI